MDEQNSFVVHKKKNRFVSPAKGAKTSRNSSVNESPRIKKDKLIFTAGKRRDSFSE